MNAPRELPTDLALPHLAQALDEAVMGEVFGAALRMHGTQLESCCAERIKYRPRRNCSLSYRLQLRDTATNRTFEQRVAARVCTSEDAVRRAGHAGAAVLAATAAGPALRLFPALDMLTWWWPNDPKLSAPRVLADERVLREQVLPEVVAALSGGHGTLIDYQLEVVQYVPEHRLCARVDLHWLACGGRVRQTVYAKSSREPGGATAHAILRDLQASEAWHAGHLRTPRALLWQPAFGLHWQEALPGRAMQDLSPAESLCLAPRLGEQLAALHGTAVAAPRVVTPQSLRARLDEVCDILAYVLPDSSAALRRARDYLYPGFAALELAGTAAVTLHGDLHARNILVDGGELGLIDLDGLQRGPAVMELGGWIAGCMYRALLEQATPARDSATWRAMFDAYAGAGGRVPNAQVLAWATAWNLLCQRAWRCVVNLKTGRYAIAPRVIALACEVARARTLEAA